MLCDSSADRCLPLGQTPGERVGVSLVPSHADAVQQVADVAVNAEKVGVMSESPAICARCLELGLGLGY